jgi:hypothetical protein
MRETHRLPIKRACAVAGLSRAAYYRPVEDRLVRDGEVIDALNGIVQVRARWGFWKCSDRLRLDGRGWNHKRVWRVRMVGDWRDGTEHAEANEEARATPYTGAFASGFRRQPRLGAGLHARRAP